MRNYFRVRLFAVCLPTPASSTHAVLILSCMTTASPASHNLSSIPKAFCSVKLIFHKPHGLLARCACPVRLMDRLGSEAEDRGRF